LLKAAFNTINQTKAQCLSFVLFTMEPDHLKHIYSCIVRFIDLQPKCMLQSIFKGGHRSTWRKQPTCRKSLTNFIT
jgi:hypothetical protein